MFCQRRFHDGEYDFCKTFSPHWSIRNGDGLWLYLHWVSFFRGCCLQPFGGSLRWHMVIWSQCICHRCNVRNWKKNHHLVYHFKFIDCHHPHASSISRFFIDCLSILLQNFIAIAITHFNCFIFLFNELHFNVNISIYSIRRLYSGKSMGSMCFEYTQFCILFPLFDRNTTHDRLRVIIKWQTQKLPPNI